MIESFGAFVTKRVSGGGGGGGVENFFFHGIVALARDNSRDCFVHERVEFFSQTCVERAPFSRCQL